jgi:uncharacterized membrane protein
MTRVEVFSDGVLAIAITLLVVELPFDQVSQGELAHALGEHWPRFAAYVLSFLGIGIAWLHHHALFTTLARMDRPFVLMNLLFLLAAAFLPFPTSLVGDYLKDGGGDARLAVALYSVNWAVVSLSAAAMCRHAIRASLLDEAVDRPGVHRLLRNLAGSGAAYAAFALLALVSPIATMACYGVAAVWFLVNSDFRALGRETVG